MVVQQLLVICLWFYDLHQVRRAVCGTNFRWVVNHLMRQWVRNRTVTGTSLLVFVNYTTYESMTGPIAQRVQFWVTYLLSRWLVKTYVVPHTLKIKVESSLRRFFFKFQEGGGTPEQEKTRTHPSICFHFNSLFTSYNKHPNQTHTYPFQGSRLVSWSTLWLISNNT